MKAAVIVLSWNGAADLADCLHALQDQKDAVADILVVDNGSTDGSVALVRGGFPSARVVENGRNLGFSAGMNIGIRLLRADAQPPDVVVLLNQDTVVAPGWLRHILAPLAEDAGVGAVGCKIYYPDGQTLQHAGALLEPGRATARHFGQHERDQGQYDLPRDLEWVTAAAIALRMAALDQVGLFDEGYSPAYFEDVDLCWRLRQAGYRVRYAPAATLCHAESRSTGNLVRRNALVNCHRLRFVVKTFPAERIWTDFLLAEQARLAVLPPSLEARALRRAYLEGILRGNEWLAARKRFYNVTPSEERRLGRLCADLRRDMSAFERQRSHMERNGYSGVQL